MSRYTVSLAGLKAIGFHGVLTDERRDGQPFVVDAELALQRASRADDIATTVNYADLARAIIDDIERDPVDLIETLADRIAATCLARDGVTRAQITVHKPQAPVGVPFGDVSVTVVRRPPVDVVWALGANLGDCAATLQRAVDALGDLPGTRVDAVSSVYRTAAVGDVDQPDFLNLVAVGHTDASARDLLRHARGIEDALGRTRERRWGPRTIDIDLISRGGARMERRGLILPHPWAHARAFVLVPWLEADPDAVLPGHGRVSDLVAETDADGVRRLPDVQIEVR